MKQSNIRSMVVAIAALLTSHAALRPAKADTVVSQDLAVQERLSNTSKSYQFTLGSSVAPTGSVQAMRLVYGRKSQSLSNHRNNAVDWSLEVLTDTGPLPLWQQADRYPSDTTSGTIPTREITHTVDLGTNQLFTGTRMRLTVSAATGDYLNRIEWIRVESDWNGPAAFPNVLYGVNLSGAEWGNHRTAVEGSGWAFPTENQIEYYASTGLQQLRIPLAWERLHPDLSGDLDSAYLSRMDALAGWAAKYGIALIWDLHNYGRYNGIPLGSARRPVSSLANTWEKIARHYADSPDILFSLMNEPHDMLSEKVVEMQNLAIHAIRATGSNNTIIVNGNAWTGAHSWGDSWYGTPNAEAMLDIKDPADNLIFAVHLYFDGNASGTSAEVVSETIGVDRLRGVTDWARAHGKRICIEEIGAARDSLSLAALTRTVEFVENNRDVFHSLILWAGGPLWDDYMFSVEPDANFQMAPQLQVLLPHLPAYIPHFADALILKALDLNNDNHISRAEWKKLQKPPAKRIAFNRMDTNKDGLISAVEIARIPVKERPQEWASAHTRALLFAALDIGKTPDQLTLSELTQAWPPGTSKSKISSQIQRMRGERTNKPIALNEWFLMKTIPSYTKWKESSAIREKREEKFNSLIIRPGGFTPLPGIRVNEFAKLYPKQTSKVKIREAWRIATNSPKSKNPPTYLYIEEFLECRLIGAKIR